MVKQFKTKMQQELDKLNQNNKLSYADECKLKNEPINLNLLQW